MDAPKTEPTSPAAPGGTTPTGAAGVAAMGTGAPPGSPAIHNADEAVPAPAIPPEPPLPEAIGQMWREQVDIIAQRIFLDTQALFGVGAIPPDVVVLKTIVLNLASALERGDQAGFLYTFARNSREISAQINDQTIPYQPGLQIGGHIEGVLRDTITQGLKSDPARLQQAQALIDDWCSPAYPALLGEPLALMKPLAPRL